MPSQYTDFKADCTFSNTAINLSQIDAAVNALIEAKRIDEKKHEELEKNIGDFNLQLEQSKAKIKQALINHILGDYKMSACIEMLWSHEHFSSVLGDALGDAISIQRKDGLQYQTRRICIYFYATGEIELVDLDTDKYELIDYQDAPHFDCQRYPVPAKFPFDAKLANATDTKQCVVKKHPTNITGDINDIIYVSENTIIGCGPNRIVLPAGHWLLRGEGGYLKGVSAEKLSSHTIKLIPKDLEIDDSQQSICANQLRAAVDAVIATLTINLQEYQDQVINACQEFDYQLEDSELTEIAEMVSSYNSLLQKTKLACRQALLKKLTDNKALLRDYIDFSWADCDFLIGANNEFIEQFSEFSLPLSDYFADACVYVYPDSGELVTKVARGEFRDVDYPEKPTLNYDRYHSHAEIPFNALCVAEEPLYTYDSFSSRVSEMLPLKKPMVVGHGRDRQTVSTDYAIIKNLDQDPSTDPFWRYEFMSPEQFTQHHCQTTSQAMILANYRQQLNRGMVATGAGEEPTVSGP